MDNQHNIEPSAPANPDTPVDINNEDTSDTGQLSNGVTLPSYYAATPLVGASVPQTEGATVLESGPSHVSDNSPAEVTSITEQGPSVMQHPQGVSSTSPGVPEYTQSLPYPPASAPSGEQQSLPYPAVGQSAGPGHDNAADNLPYPPHNTGNTATAPSLPYPPLDTTPMPSLPYPPVDNTTVPSLPYPTTPSSIQGEGDVVSADTPYPPINNAYQPSPTGAVDSSPTQDSPLIADQGVTQGDGQVVSRIHPALMKLPSYEGGGVYPSEPPPSYEQSHPIPFPETIAPREPSTPAQPSFTPPATQLNDRNFGANPIYTRCPGCGQQVRTVTTYVPGALTYIFVCIFLMLGWWFMCCLIPFCVQGFKDVHHVCPRCKRTIGRYDRISG